MTGDADRDGSGDVHPDEREDRPELDVDTAFAAIIAGFSQEAPPGSGPWPAAEDVPSDDRGGDARPEETFPDPRADLTHRRGLLPGEPPEDRDARHLRELRGRHTHPAQGGHRDGSAASAPSDPYTAPGSNGDGDRGSLSRSAEDEDRFVPPEPPPLPRGDLLSRLAWAGVIGGPLFLLVAALVWRDLPPALLLGALAAFVGGFVTLVARMPGEPGDDGDDGAVV